MSNFAIKDRYSIKNGATINATEDEDETFTIIISFWANDNEQNGSPEDFKANINTIVNNCLLNSSIKNIDEYAVDADIVQDDDGTFRTVFILDGLSFEQVEEIEGNYDMSVAKMNIKQSGKYVICFEGNDGEMRFVTDPNDKVTRNPEKAALIKESQLRDLLDYWDERTDGMAEEMEYRDFKMSYF